jgi:ELWxxDGT repeat protein
MVKDIYPGERDSQTNFLTESNGVLFFTAWDGSNGTELWRSDGTSEGTVMVRDINTSFRHSTPTELTDVDGTLFFTAHDPDHRRELWKSDGTEEGTVLVKDIRPGTSKSEPRNLTNVDGTLLFTANDGQHGYEFWKSDGTGDGTVLVKDIFPGESWSWPSEFTIVNGTFFFKASDSEDRIQVWRSDGTEKGTYLVESAHPSINANAYDLTPYNGQLFFSMHTDFKKGELFSTGPAVYGSSGDDLITINIGNRIRVSLNDQSYSFPLGEFTYVGSGGSDTIYVYGTAGDEKLVASPDSFEFTGSDFRINGLETSFLTVRGRGGNDEATLFDSEGNERVVAKLGNTFVRDLAKTYTHRVLEFGLVNLKSPSVPGNNFDLVNLFDSPGSDTFVSEGSQSEITGPSYRITTEGYDRNVARSILGGDDIAVLNGTLAGGENFTARVTGDPKKNFGSLRSANNAAVKFRHRAIGFSHVIANSIGGHDKAYLFGGQGFDSYLGAASIGEMEGQGYRFTANHFNRINVNAGGNKDEAVLIDGAGDDRLVATQNVAKMLGAAESFTHRATGFAKVIANASEGGFDVLDVASDLAFSLFEDGEWELKK